MRMKDWVLGLLFFGSLCLAGSDGLYFPWVNLLGLGGLALVVAAA